MQISDSSDQLLRLQRPALQSCDTTLGLGVGLESMASVLPDSMGSCVTVASPPSKASQTMGLPTTVASNDRFDDTRIRSFRALEMEFLPLLPTSHRSMGAPSFMRQLHVPSHCITQAPRGIDMNQIPSSAESDDAADSSPTSMVSPFREDGSRRNESGLPTKREREKLFDFEHDKTCEVNSRARDEEEAGGTRKKLRLSKEQSSLLEESFTQHSTLNPKQKTTLAKQLNLRTRQVEVWFQNRRARTKLKQTEVDCELLKRFCESLREENRRLQKELQELRALKVAPQCMNASDYYMPLPAATLTMCPSCERVSTLDNKRFTNNKRQLQQRAC